jgi:predicted TPR repeat methyltransferase
MLNTGERIAEVFDGVADLYDDLATQADYFISAWIPRHIQDITGLDQCEVLDLGCGTGLNIKALCEQREGVHAHGVDVSAKMLEKARASNLYHKLYVHDLTKPLPDISSGSFDLVIAFGLLDYLPDVSTLLSECHRVLKSGGTLWTSFRRFEAEDEASPPRHVTVRGLNWTGYSAAEILYMMQCTGMSVVGVNTITGYITRTGFACPYSVVRARKS